MVLPSAGEIEAGRLLLRSCLATVKYGPGMFPTHRFELEVEAYEADEARLPRWQLHPTSTSSSFSKLWLSVPALAGVAVAIRISWLSSDTTVDWKGGARSACTVTVGFVACKGAEGKHALALSHAGRLLEPA